MMVVVSQQGAVLVLALLLSMGVLLTMCLWCRKRSKIIQEANHLYDPQHLSSEGRTIKVTHSKRVTNLNQFSGPSNQEMISSQTCAAAPVAAEDQFGYQNVTFHNGSPTYVDPIATLLYQNLPEPSKDSAEYENVFRTVNPPLTQDSDGSDYENSQFLQEHQNKGAWDSDTDEGDYINTPGCTL